MEDTVVNSQFPDCAHAISRLCTPKHLRSAHLSHSAVHRKINSSAQKFSPRCNEGLERR